MFHCTAPPKEKAVGQVHPCFPVAGVPDSASGAPARDGKRHGYPDNATAREQERFARRLVPGPQPVDGIAVTEPCFEYLAGMCRRGQRCPRFHIGSNVAVWHHQPTPSVDPLDHKHARVLVANSDPCRGSNDKGPYMEVPVRDHLLCEQSDLIDREKSLLWNGESLKSTFIPSGICRDYVRGKCTREQCRHLHSLPHDLARHSPPPPRIPGPRGGHIQGQHSSRVENRFDARDRRNEGYSPLQYSVTSSTVRYVDRSDPSLLVDRIRGHTVSEISNGFPSEGRCYNHPEHSGHLFSATPSSFGAPSTSCPEVRSPTAVPLPKENGEAQEIRVISDRYASVEVGHARLTRSVQRIDHRPRLTPKEDMKVQQLRLAGSAHVACQQLVELINQPGLPPAQLADSPRAGLTARDECLKSTPQPSPPPTRVTSDAQGSPIIYHQRLQVCVNYLRGRCLSGSKCHRIHMYTPCARPPVKAVTSPIARPGSQLDSQRSALKIADAPYPMLKPQGPSGLSRAVPCSTEQPKQVPPEATTSDTPGVVQGMTAAVPGSSLAQYVSPNQVSETLGGSRVPIRRETMVSQNCPTPAPASCPVEVRSVPREDEAHTVSGQTEALEHQMPVVNSITEVSVASTAEQTFGVKLPIGKAPMRRRHKPSRKAAQSGLRVTDDAIDIQTWPAQGTTDAQSGDSFATTSVGLRGTVEFERVPFNVRLPKKKSQALAPHGKLSHGDVANCCAVPPPLKEDVRNRPPDVSLQKHGPDGRRASRSARVDDQRSPRATSSTPEDSTEPSRVYSLGEASDVENIIVFNSTKVRFGPGFIVEDVWTSFESYWVILSNVPRGTEDSQVQEILSPFGVVRELHKSFDRNHQTTMSFRARFNDTRQAAEAVAVLNGAEILDTVIYARTPPNNMKSGRAEIRDTGLLFTWDAPSWTGYAGYATLSEAQNAIGAAERDKRWGKAIRASIHDGTPVLGAVTVAFRGMPTDLKVTYLENFGQPDDTMHQAERTPSATQVAGIIRRELQNLGHLVSFYQTPAPYRDGKVYVQAYFRDAPSAKVARDHFIDPAQPIEGLESVSMSVEHLQYVAYTVGSDIFKVLQADIEDLRTTSGSDDPKNTIEISQETPYTVDVELHGSDLKSLSNLKYGFERLLRGEVMKEDGQYVWDPFFANHAGSEFLFKLQETYPDVRIQCCKRKRRITIFASPSKRQEVKRAVLERIEELRRCKTLRIPIPRRLIGRFVKCNLPLLQQKIGQENLSVDYASPAVVVRGDSASELVRVAVQEALHSTGPIRASSTSECPVCLDEPIAPIVLRCGHAWCKVCLSNYFSAAVEGRSFPMTCLGDEGSCTCRIPVAVAREVLTSDELEELAAAAFTAHVFTHPEEYKWCPGPDCEEVYRSGPPDTVLQCPRCLRRICAHCHVEHHEGMSCAEHKAGLEPEFALWRAGHDVKNCPKCKTAIEKVDGCNHMMCSVCQSHICWVCLKTFVRGEGVYDHMRAKHGGIGV